MSRHLHLDPIGGVAGDMLLGLWIELGLPLETLQSLASQLGLDDVNVQAEPVVRASLAATHVTVSVRGQVEGPARQELAHDDEHPHHHADLHSHHHEQPHSHHHVDEHSHQHEHPSDGHGRTLGQMLMLIERGALTPRAATLAQRAITLLFEAEATAHGLSIDAVHLHEAGADDALIDILGTATALEALQIESVSCSVPLPIGGGHVSCAHGLMPVPVPAVAELLRGLAVVGGPVQRETITPTGAALLRAMVTQFGPAPPMTIDRSGSGAGGRDTPQIPNIVRGMLGRTAAGPSQRTVTVLETALDDILPQDVPVLIEALLARGARDAMVTPVTMKKGRPGLLLTVIADAHTARDLAEFVLDHSPALGVRMREETRLEWDRDFVSVATPWGSVRIKRALDSAGGVRRGRPEFDDCARAAATSGVSPDEVRRRAQQLFDDTLRDDSRREDS